MKPPVDAEVLKKNKIKEVMVFTSDSSGKNKTLFEHYFIGQEGCPRKQAIYDRFSGGDRPAIMEYDISPDNREKTYIHSRKKSDGILQVYKKQTEYFTGSGKLLKRITVTDIDFTTVTTEIFDTANYEKQDKTIVKIHGEKDTLQIITDYNDLNTKIHVLKNKINGQWVETEKSITEYRERKFDSYKLYKNDKLVQSYTQKELDEKKDKRKSPLENHMEDFNPLPYYEHKTTDTLYTNDIIQLTPVKLYQSKYLIVKHYSNKELEYIEVFYRQNPLLYIRITMPLKSREIFEYVK